MLRSTFAATTVIGVLLLSPFPSAAEPQLRPSPGIKDCDTGWVCVQTGDRGKGDREKASKGSESRGTRQCSKNGRVLPCYDPDLGSFSSGCYYKQIKDPTLIADMRKTATSAGQANGLAAYEMTCLLDGSSPGSVYVFLKNPPAKVVDPATLARQAVDKMLLEGPEVTSPRAGGKYVVGMPMWMWVDQTPTTYGPNRATASVGGVSVTATAVVSWISWAMGDGTAAVVCKGPGTKYTSSMGMARSPDCGHVYGRASVAEAGGKFHGTATATWSVDWRVAGVRAETGSFTEVRRSRFTAVVGEVQVLN